MLTTMELWREVVESMNMQNVVTDGWTKILGKIISDRFCLKILVVAIKSCCESLSLICKSTLSRPKIEDRFTRKSQRSVPGWKKYGKGSTTCCPYTLPPASQVTGLVTGFKYKIKDSVTCEMENVVYY